MTIPYPRIPPEIFRVGPFAVRWYGVMYIVGYAVGIGVARGRVRRGLVPFDEKKLDSLVGYLVIGMLLGARLVYVFVYDPAVYAAHPLTAFAIWRGGLSFHGAVLGMTAACVLFARRYHIPFWTVADTLALGGTPGLFFGRIGNFINGELYGRPTSVGWAMIFPTDPLRLPRHPSQLYEAICEGLLLFCLLRWLESRAVRAGWYRPGLLAGAFLICYGTLRFLLEFTRQPDIQLGLVIGRFSMGQVLSSLMIVAGVIVLIFIYSGAPSTTWRADDSKSVAGPVSTDSAQPAGGQGE
ncbi:MAG: prolipoprotein diacylglyceryl transferase [Gemmatimonadaceae bacterium]